MCGSLLCCEVLRNKHTMKHSPTHPPSIQGILFEDPKITEAAAIYPIAGSYSRQSVTIRLISVERFGSDSGPESTTTAAAESTSFKLDQARLISDLKNDPSHKSGDGVKLRAEVLAAEGGDYFQMMRHGVSSKSSEASSSEEWAKVFATQHLVPGVVHAWTVRDWTVWFSIHQAPVTVLIAPPLFEQVFVMSSKRGKIIAGVASENGKIVEYGWSEDESCIALAKNSYISFVADMLTGTLTCCANGDKETERVLPLPDGSIIKPFVKLLDPGDQVCFILFCR